MKSNSNDEQRTIVPLANSNDPVSTLGNLSFHHLTFYFSPSSLLLCLPFERNELSVKSFDIRNQSPPPSHENRKIEKSRLLTCLPVRNSILDSRQGETTCEDNGLSEVSTLRRVRIYSARARSNVRQLL